MSVVLILFGVLAISAVIIALITINHILEEREKENELEREMKAKKEERIDEMLDE